MPPSSRHRHPLLPPCLLALFVNFAMASGPLVDFDRMGQVGLAGAFAGLDIANNASSITFDQSTASILSRSSNGGLTKLASTNAGGSIRASCAIGDVLYFAGEFSSVGDVSASNVASYSSGKVSTVGSGGPNGAINALFCDASRRQVWAGGRFSTPGANVAVFDVASSSWSAAPFGGLTGAAAEVFSLTTNSSQSSLFLSGSFIASLDNNSVPLNNTNNPNVPFSSGATPFSSSLVPVPLGGAEVTAQGSTSDAQFSDIHNVLCPEGGDGPGNSWFAADGNKAVITVRKFSFINAHGVRIGNTFLDGHGTTAFSVATIPDNAVRQLTYFDQADGQNKTCTDPCPLKRDSSVPYQDFLFDSDINITGFQLTLSEWTGASPGLHILQVLSSGAFAAAADSQNGKSCFAPGASTTARTGDWQPKTVDTGIAATTQDVLVSTVDVGTDASQAPSFTWRPYVSASGQYDINLLVPGCTNMQDCDLRTSVTVTVFPVDGQPPSVTEVDQRNTADKNFLLYSGPVVPTSPEFTTTVIMKLSGNPQGSGQGGKYELVADRVQLLLTSANLTANGDGSANSGSTNSGKRAFGFYEFPFGSKTASATGLDAVGSDLLSALGGATALTGNTDSVIRAVAHHSSGTIFLGGKFTLTSGPASGATNVVAFKNGALTALSNNGLNGDVTSLAVSDDQLYVGGSFTNTAQASQDLRGIASYSVQNNQWSPLIAGVDKTVKSLDIANKQLLVAGDFTELLNTGVKASGFATWDLAKNTWINSGGFLVGSMTLAGNGVSDTQIVAGNVASSLRFGASGFVLLQNGNGGEPEVKPLGVQFDSAPTNAAKTGTPSRRHHGRRSTAGWIPSLNVLSVFKRQSAAALAPLPAAPSTPAPAVLAGVFWTNTTSSKQVAIIGGDFSFTASSGGASQNLAIYDDSSKTIQALRGNPPTGTVRTLLVKGNSLYVGGDFTIQGSDAAGFAVYDLERGEWDTTGLQALQAASGSKVNVRSITASPAQDNVIYVAGSFAQAGSTACRAICALDTGSKQWSALGNGVQGEISAVVYSGNSDLIAAGSVALADGTAANVAQYSFANSTWAAVGDASTLPGPATAVEINDNDLKSIFAAGRSTDGSSPYLYFWNGQSWNAVGSTLQGTTDVSQLVMVPLQNTHAGNGVIQPDRALLVSGVLSDKSFGNASSALFDGQSLTPYVVSTSASGTPGVVSSLFHSLSSFSFEQRHFLATGVVILISIAIAAGIVFLLALIEILWALFARRNDKVAGYEGNELDADDDSTHHPSSLLAHINAATRTTILGTQSPFNQFNAEKEAEAGGAAVAAHERDDPFAPDSSNYVRAETPSDAIVGAMDGEEMARPAYARYSFDGKGEGELPLKAGQELEVLDDRDAAWWYARDARTGNEGVVPAAYVY